MSTLFKKCLKCEKIKETKDFWLSKRHSDGLQTYCKECSKRSRKLWADDNKDKISRYRKPVPYSDRERNWHRNNYKKNKDKILARNKEWASSNPDKVRVLSLAGTNRRKVRQLNCGGSHTHQEWIDLLEKCGHRCVSCGQKKKLSKDHIIPLIKGGSDFITNIQPLCRECNSSKRDKVVNFLLDPKPEHVNFV